MSLANGTRLGSYEVIAELGVGGMGEVYRARDTKLGRDVAIKTLPAALAADKDRLARFEREAKVLAALNHAHIGAIYGLDEHAGTLYIAMELVEGATLEEKLKAGPLAVEDALRLALQIAEALEAAHEKGVVHRDLKPANVMLTREGQVKVLDFGLAKAFAGNPSEASPAHSPALSLAMTQQGLILGTAGYMAPEQASGQGTDQRADIWAYGVVLYEMLTGLPLFKGESVPHILAAVLQTEPDWNRLPRNLHPRLKLLLERCLEKKPRNRYHSIADARVDIEKVLSDPQGPVVGEPPAAGPRRSIAARAAASIALLAAGAAVAGIVAWTLWPGPPPAAINRWAYTVPEDHALRNTGRAVVAFSPDGRRFVYNTSDGLYVRSMDELEVRLIPGTAENLTHPFFSADGQSLAYWSSANGQLKRVALSGGAPVVIASGVANPNGASWAFDGTILFGQPAGIYRVSANGGTPELVVAAEEGERLDAPVLLPDGDSVLFSVTTTASWDAARIVVQSLSSGERTELVSGGSDARYVPTGHLVYALGNGLFAIAFDLSTLTVSGGPVSLVQGVARAGATTATANYGVSNDGTLVYLDFSAALISGWMPVWVDRDGNEEPIGIDACACVSPALSPDGTRLAYDFPTPDTSDADVWVRSLAQRTSTRLTFEPGFQLGAMWSPDSTRIAYTSLGEGILVRPADGTGMPERVVESANTLVAWAWSAQDELIFSELTNATGVDIGIVDLAGDRERRPLLATAFNEYRPALSPDRRWLAYSSDESGQVEIYVRPFPEVGSGKWQVSSGGGDEPKWSRDGRTLLYLGPQSVMEVIVGDRGTGFTHELPQAIIDREPYEFNPLPPRRYEISPDGQRVLLMKLPGPGTGILQAPPQIIVVTSWVEELEQRVPTP